MNGISNRLSAEVEVQNNRDAVENFDRRIIETGKIPGTHSLGAAFRTTSISEDAHVQKRSEESLVAWANSYSRLRRDFGW